MGSALPLLVPALILVQAQPTFYAAWEDGREAEGKHRFAAALAAYQRAAELRPQSAPRVIIYGNNLLKGYWPYTRIARCCLELEQWDAAGKALGLAERQGEPPGERLALASRWKAVQPRETAAPAPPPPAAPLPPSPAPAVEPAPAPAPPVETRAPPEAVPLPPQRPALAAAPRVPPAAVGVAAAAVSAPPVGQGRSHPWLPLGLAGLVAAGVAAFSLGRRKQAPRAPGSHEPERIGPYQVQRLLGRGGFASTYLALRDGTRAPVALKVLHSFRQDDPEFLGRFRQEARLGALLHHPNIVRLLDQGPDHDSPWLAMEFVEGRRLDAILKEIGPLPLSLLVALARQVASAMAYAHSQGVIHRDLKPANVMIVGDQAKVMDFGIARIMDAETLTTTYAFLGTPLYAAPELQTKTQVGPAADHYSFGIMLFEMMAGRPPFQGETPFMILDQHRRTELPDPAALRPDAPDSLVDLVRRLARKDPAQRPGDDEILRSLEAIAPSGKLET